MPERLYGRKKLRKLQQSWIMVRDYTMQDAKFIILMVFRKSIALHYY